MAVNAIRWSPITDLDGGDLSLASQELPPLAAVWSEQRSSLGDQRGLAHFNERLAREWAVETGVLERLYTLDRGITQLLIERGIDESLIPDGATDRPPAQVAALILDHRKAVDWLFDLVKGGQPLTLSFIKELHALMTRNQPTVSGIDSGGRAVEIPLRHGQDKIAPNNPVRPDGSIHEYCPPEQVAPEMERLVDWHLEHTERKIPLEVASAWLHHRFAQIHPFQDGNGRVARALATLVFLRGGWFPLVINRDDRERYLDALEEADSGDLGMLVDLFAQREKKAFVNALSIASDVLREGDRVDQVIGAISDMFRARDEPLRKELERAKDLARGLHLVASRRFDRLSNELGEAIGSAVGDRQVFRDSGSPDDPERRRWHGWQVIESAKALGYFANRAEFSAWNRVCMETENGRSEILLSFHAVGQDFRGVIGASLGLYRRQEGEAGERQIVDHHTESDEVFQINYKESRDAAQARFEVWLDRGLVAALETWRRGE